MRFNIGGITSLTTIDFPGHLAAVVFCQGCAWRCPCCHNPHLLPFSANSGDWRQLQAFLEPRRGLLDGVVFSGGEPLFQSGLIEVIKNVRAMGFKIALHTAGIHPGRFKKMLPYLDWVGLDIKTLFEHYPQITGVANSGARARASLALLLESGIAYEVRTTADPDFLNRTILLVLSQALANAGVTHYVLQECRPVASEHQIARTHAAAFFHDHSLLQQLHETFHSFIARRA